MRSALNPFNPGSGLKPPALVGRDAELNAAGALFERSAHGLQGRGIILSGLRGVGKTVLLNEVRDAAESAGWIVASFEARPDDAGKVGARQTLARELTAQMWQLQHKSGGNNKVKKALGTIASFNAKIGVSGLDLGVTLNPGRADSGNVEIDLPELISDISSALKQEHRALGIIIDELQDLDQELLRALLIAQHQSGQRGWPFYLIGAGLPHLPGVLAEARSYAERLFDYQTVASLSADLTAAALIEPLRPYNVFLEQKALEMLVAESGGYPYFIQELGRAAWEVSAGPIITYQDALNAVGLALARLDQGFFRSRWERATTAERRMLVAMASGSDEPELSSEVAKRMGIQPSSLGPYRARLIHKGLVYAPDHGLVAFTVPGMNGFIKRHRDDEVT